MCPAEVAEVLRLVLPCRNGCGKREIVTAFVERDGRLSVHVDEEALPMITPGQAVRFIEDTDPHYRDYRAGLITPGELVTAILNIS